MHNDLSDLLHWLFDTDPLGIPEAEQRARLLLLDTLGCYIAGQNNQRSRRSLNVLRP